MKQSIGWLDTWFGSVGTKSILRRALVKYSLGRGADSMKDIVFEEGRNHKDMEILKHSIWWRCFIEGMILKEVVKLRKDCVVLREYSLFLDKWAQELKIWPI